MCHYSDLRLYFNMLLRNQKGQSLFPTFGGCEVRELDKLVLRHKSVSNFYLTLKLLRLFV